MAMRRPVSSLQQPSAKQTELNYFADNTIDLHPVPYANSVWSHQNEPTAKRQNEILKDHREARGYQTYDGWHLSRHSEDYQQDQQEPEDLCPQTQNRAHCLFLAKIVRDPRQCELKCPASQDR